ncbi:hypothetical protein KP509_11G048700 [Ceratopteris richardii]|nr:hypothetical protein KP509_11G048700 [Ceratopteris richardii]
MCSPREHFDINHGRSFPEIKSARARPRCRVSRRKRDRGWPNIQVLQEDCCDEGIKEHNRRVLNVGASKINPSERGILGSQAERAQALHMGSSLKGSLDDVDFIEQGTFSVSKRKMCPADTSKLAEASKINCAALASSVQEGSVIEVSLDAIQELPESNELKNSGVRVLHPLEQNDKRMEYVTARSSLPLEHLPMNSKAVVHSESIAQFDAANNHVTEHYLNHPGGNWSKSPCFSKLLLNSSDVSSSSSEDSSELSQALQNLSGGQSNKSTNTDMCCPADPELRHSAQQSVASFLSSEKGGATAISSHYQKALLWILEQDTAYQRSALHIDMTLILRRFGNLLLHMVPHEGVHMLTLEPLFKETFSVAKSFLKVFSLYVFELNKESLKNHYLCVQKDKKVSSVRMAPLPTTVFLHEHHIRYGIQALLNEAIFDGFDKVSCCGIDPNAEGWIFLVEYQCFCMVAPMDAINPMNESYNREFHSFCSKKLQLMKDRSPWLSEWPDRLLESFLEAMKYVWLAHLIVCASVNGVHILQFQQWSPYDSLVMEVADHDHDAASFIDRVQFMLCPGFELQSSVIKSEVYLIPKNT